jgi:calcium channel MID1
VNEIFLQDGLGIWTSPFLDGGVLAVEGLPPGASYEVGVSTSGVFFLRHVSTKLFVHA